MIKIELNFSESDINDILEGLFFGDSPITVKDLKTNPQMMKDFVDEFTRSNFVDEIVANSDHSAADDWMSDFIEKYGEDEEEDN